MPEIDWLWALERLRGAYADATLKEAALAFAGFERWCAGCGEAALPARPEAVAGFVAALFPTYSARTVETRLAHIRYVHWATRLPDPTKHQEVRLAFRRGLRTHGARARQTGALTSALRDRLIRACPEDSLLGLRDRVILSLGYDTLCRRSELVALRIEDLERLSGGGGRIRLRRSKTDQTGAGSYAFLSAGCLEIVDAWMTAAPIASGPIIRPVYKGCVKSRRMHDRVVIDRLRAVAALAGLPPQEAGRLTGHSLRVGAAQDLAAAGCSLIQIMRAGRWRGLEAVSLYVRDSPINIWTSDKVVRRFGPARIDG